jgi:hypothetical protein
MDLALAIFAVMVIVCAAYGLGHWFGYERGEDDTLERVRFIQWNESRGVTREEYFKGK